MFTYTISCLIGSYLCYIVGRICKCCHHEKLYFFIIKKKQTNDTMLPCICSVTDHKRRQNMARIPLTHPAAPSVPLFCSYEILTSSVI